MFTIGTDLRIGMLMSDLQVVLPQLPFRNTSTKGAGVGVAGLAGTAQNQPEKTTTVSYYESECISTYWSAILKVWRCNW